MTILPWGSSQTGEGISKFLNRILPSPLFLYHSVVVMLLENSGANMLLILPVSFILDKQEWGKKNTFLMEFSIIIFLPTPLLNRLA